MEVRSGLSTMTPAPPLPSAVPTSQFLVFYPRDSLRTDKKICRHMSSPSPLSTTALTLILFCTFLPAIHQGDHTASVQNRFLILFFFLSNCMHGDQGGRSFCCNHCFPGAVWLGGQELRSSQSRTHIVVLQSDLSRPAGGHANQSSHFGRQFANLPRG